MAYLMLTPKAPDDILLDAIAFLEMQRYFDAHANESEPETSDALRTLRRAYKEVKEEQISRL